MLTYVNYFNLSSELLWKMRKLLENFSYVRKYAKVKKCEYELKTQSVKITNSSEKAQKRTIWS
jgi:hypothetical protein